ncbi:MAG: hypothetical protein HY737_04560 [Candidatus Omnitrophica bacterium]|nr:hypothetical protein [Candidatus Omnitrophota bacterium]
MKRWYRTVLWALALVAAAALTAEDHFRRLNAEQYRQAVERRVALEQRVAHIVKTHDRLQETLQREQQRSQELTAALAKTQAQLEQVVGRLNEENQNVQTLKLRLSNVHQQVDKLQVELAMALQLRQGATAGAAGAAGPLQLQRVIVSSAESPGLQGHILSVHPDWDFVVVDFGWNTVNVGDIISITRDKTLLAKARVERVQEAVCAATILPEWKTTEIRVHDLAKLL